MQPHPHHEQAYAIVRVDQDAAPGTTPENRITVKKIVGSEELARAEVDRLNRLNAAKGCIYFWQATRLEKASFWEADASAKEKVPLTEDKGK
jgi:hypothetical protein